MLGGLLNHQADGAGDFRRQSQLVEVFFGQTGAAQLVIVAQTAVNGIVVPNRQRHPLWLFQLSTVGVALVEQVFNMTQPMVMTLAASVTTQQLTSAGGSRVSIEPQAVQGMLPAGFQAHDRFTSQIAKLICVNR